MALGLLIVVFAFLQLTLVPQVFGSGFTINLVLVFVIAWSMLRVGKEAIGLAFIGGLILSLFSDLHFGFLPLIYVLIAFTSSLTSGETIRDNLLLAAGFSLVWCLLFELLIWVSLLFSNYVVDTGAYLSKVVLARALWNCAFVVLFLPFLRRVESLFFSTKKISIIK